MLSVLQLDVPDLAVGVYPEREDKDMKALDRFALDMFRRVKNRLSPPYGRLKQIAERVLSQQSVIADLTDVEIRRELKRIAPATVINPENSDLPKALALLREACARSLGVLPYPTQVMGATVLLQGRLAEMQTGEGKTLTAGLAACLAGVAGLPTHVVTVNDYLAERDAEKIGPLFRFFDLTVGTVINGMTPAQKKLAYACPIVYCTNKELVFDYLRDRVAAGGRVSQIQMRVRALHGNRTQPLMLRGLHFAIVDETDSILIDEARTPLILSEKAGSPPDAEIYHQAISLGGQLVEGKHFTINRRHKRLRLKSAGKITLAQLALSLTGIWQVAQAREHLAIQALRAMHLFQRDHHYLLADDQVHIIDEYTGRILPGRKWEQGLHQMIEAKEGIAMSEPVQTLARITYQRFFCRYLRLAGMTGTAREVDAELLKTYRLEVISIPTFKPCIRVTHSPIVCSDDSSKWQKIANLTSQFQKNGQPVLIGTRSVLASEQLSKVLNEAGIIHNMLNARQDAEEAAIVANAGQPGIVTVATNMAGRGTDISLHPNVPSKGGLVVIVSEFHESARIDRQLVGRCARQGDPGYCVAVVSLTDALFQEHGGLIYQMMKNRYGDSSYISTKLLVILRGYAQTRAELLNAKIRKATLKQDRQLDNTLAFAGNQI
jgi:preprotein translocase subunit SecA